MNTNDRQIIDWFKSQFNDKDSIKNITYPIGYYIDNTIRDAECNLNKAEKMHNLLKAIRQDFTKILVTVNRIEWINSLDNKDLFLSSKELIPNTTKNNLIATDIEYFFLKYKSIIDYSIDLLANFYPNIKDNKKYNLEDKLKYLHDIFDDSSFINKNILSSKWFDQFRKIRNNIVHNGGTCVVFDNNNSQEILFQIYKTNLDELVIDGDYYKFNENVYYFNRIFIVYISYLYFYLDMLFKSIISKKENINFDCVDSYIDTTNKNYIDRLKLMNLDPSYLTNIYLPLIVNWLNKI